MANVCRLNQPKQHIFCTFLIDQVVDLVSGHKLLIFMDALLRYNQIHMDEENEERTSFIMD